MLRWSMLLSWWELIRNPGRFKRRNSLGFELGSPGGTKHMSLSRPLASEQAAREAEAKARPLSLPVPGEVSHIDCEKSLLRSRHLLTPLLNDEGDEAA